MEGHSLAQTVFTNLYTHNPALIEDRILKALTLAVLKMVDSIKDKVIKGAVFEEASVLDIQMVKKCQIAKLLGTCLRPFGHLGREGKGMF